MNTGSPKIDIATLNKALAPVEIGAKPTRKRSSSINHSPANKKPLPNSLTHDSQSTFDSLSSIIKKSIEASYDELGVNKLDTEKNEENTQNDSQQKRRRSTSVLGESPQQRRQSLSGNSNHAPKSPSSLSKSSATTQAKRKLSTEGIEDVRKSVVDKLLKK
jgi:hypothetical protein